MGCNGKGGLVPPTHIREMKANAQPRNTSPFGARQPPAKKTSSPRAPPPATTGPPPMPKSPARPAQKPPTPKARVLYAYAAQHPGDLELTVGTIVELTKTEGGWWEGTYNGARGIFPANYVERI